MFRRLLTRVAAAAVATTLCVGLLAVPEANAATKPRVFANCMQMNKVYPHGVGKVGAHDRGKGKNFRPVTTFKRDTALYQANIKRDGDRDGVACEKR